MKVSREILQLVPYTPGKPISETQREFGLKTVHKLASNENAFGYSPKVRQALMEAMERLNRYPDPACYDLVGTISQLWPVPRSMVAVGNGSNEIIDILIRIFCEPGDAILSFAGSFIAYNICARAARARPLIVPHEEDFALRLEKMAEFLRQRKKEDRIRLVFIPNPNNPTGVYIPKAEVEAFLKEFGRDPDLLVIFDEAYTEFVRAEDNSSVLGRLKEFPSAVVLRTLSKTYGLAGLRVGILLASEEIIGLFHRVRNPFNVNELAQVAAAAALKDQDFVKQVVQATWKGLDYLTGELKNLGMPVIPSQANFLLFDTLRDARAVNEALLRRGVILRPVLNYGYPRHLRITSGTEVENRAAIEALTAVLPGIQKIV